MNVTTTTKASPNIWSSHSLHRFNEDTLMISSTKVIEEDSGPKAKSTPNRERRRIERVGSKDRDDNTPIAEAPHVAAAAAVAVEESQSRSNNNRTGLFRWFGSPPNPADQDSEQQDMQTVPEPIATNTAASDASSEESIIGPDLATRLWWVNVWTQQLPGIPEEQLQQINSERVETRTLEARNAIPESVTKEPSVVEPNFMMNTTYQISDTAAEEEPPPSFVSTGVWAAIDGLLSLGLSQVHPAFRVSRPLRPIRKGVAHVTGLHGILSGKPRMTMKSTDAPPEDVSLGEEDLMMVRRRIAAIDKAREGVERVAKTKAPKARERKGGSKTSDNQSLDIDDRNASPEVKMPTMATGMTIPSIRKSPEELREEQLREARVQAIDKEMGEAQRRLLELACEKDVLQRRPNPLWNYTTEKAAKKRQNHTSTSRTFNFPPEDLVVEYLDFLFSTGRLMKMNHTDLWSEIEEDEDESLGDDFSSSLSDDEGSNRKRNRNSGKGGGSWLLRQSLGSSSSLGEKIGEATEQAAYKSITRAVMQVLARSISALHGVNIMSHTDIRLSVEATPDLPPMLKQGIIPGGKNSNYAREALQGAMRGATKRSRASEYPNGETFAQHAAVVETFLSHCQISAPLLQLFPLAWQRAMLSNIILLVTAVMSDFCEGIQFEILGHRLSFAFKPITESDMMSHISMLAGPYSNQQRWKTEQFESAVRATAQDVSENLKFLDRWHERLLGSGVLRSQVANLIARLVLTLIGDILSGAQMDLWAAHAGGPRMVAGLEFRTTPTYAT